MIKLLRHRDVAVGLKSEGCGGLCGGAGVQRASAEIVHGVDCRVVREHGRGGRCR